MKRSKTSMTNEEIEAFWRHKQQEIELHAKKDDDRNANSLLVSWPYLKISLKLPLHRSVTPSYPVRWIARTMTSATNVSSSDQLKIPREAALVCVWVRVGQRRKLNFYEEIGARESPESLQYATSWMRILFFCSQKRPPKKLRKGLQKLTSAANDARVVSTKRLWALAEI